MAREDQGRPHRRGPGRGAAPGESDLCGPRPGATEADGVATLWIVNSTIGEGLWIEISAIENRTAYGEEKAELSAEEVRGVGEGR